MKTLLSILVVGLLLPFTGRPVAAQEGKTYETQEPVYDVVLIHIHPNQGDKYLNALEKTWVPGVEEAIKEGLTEDYHIYESITPQDRGFNLLLVTKSPNLATFDATAALRKKLDEIQKRVEARMSQAATDSVTDLVYPQIRTILSEKLVREIKFMGQ
ncbi:MAG TPA: hypothetical protein VJ997_06065 [Longimicrobiales bacterium]|nr:hypothetical protein [Longimicrobiales bacterium]